MEFVKLHGCSLLLLLSAAVAASYGNVSRTELRKLINPERPVSPMNPQTPQSDQDISLPPQAGATQATQDHICLL